MALNDTASCGANLSVLGGCGGMSCPQSAAVFKKRSIFPQIVNGFV